MKTQLLMCVVIVMACRLAEAEIIHGTNSVNISSHHWEPRHPDCPQLGDTLMLEFIGQRSAVGLNGTSHGFINGQMDGFSDPGPNDSISMFWPPAEGSGGDGRAKYDRDVGGTMHLLFFPKGLEWEWSFGSTLCMGLANQPNWTYATMFHDGDANRSGTFDSHDLVQVFQAGEYEDGIYRNSTWETGDWNGDLEFDSSDMVAAMVTGRYGAPATVPEPHSGLIIALALVAGWLYWRHSK